MFPNVDERDKPGMQDLAWMRDKARGCGGVGVGIGRAGEGGDDEQGGAVTYGSGFGVGQDPGKVGEALWRGDHFGSRGDCSAPDLATSHQPPATSGPFSPRQDRRELDGLGRLSGLEGSARKALARGRGRTSQRRARPSRGAGGPLPARAGATGPGPGRLARMISFLRGKVLTDRISKVPELASS
jgi:hypothetical protein